MAGQIVTVRHGRPSLSRDCHLDWRGFGDWWAAYDRSGLHEAEAPPEPLIRIGAEAEHAYSSTLPRAIETARRILGDDRTAPACDLFVEAPLPAPPAPFLKLRPGVWGVVSRVYWFVGYSPQIESHAGAWRRVFRAADKLIATSQTGDVLLCAHGYFNWMLDKALRRRGLRRLHNGGNHYWAWRTYAPAPEKGSP
ncbi:MAG: histidine phosphatase family protein [Pseudomonadota bacterium]